MARGHRIDSLILVVVLHETFCKTDRLPVNGQHLASFQPMVAEFLATAVAFLVMAAEYREMVVELLATVRESRTDKIESQVEKRIEPLALTTWTSESINVNNAALKCNNSFWTITLVTISGKTIQTGRLGGSIVHIVGRPGVH